MWLIALSQQPERDANAVTTGGPLEEGGILQEEQRKKLKNGRWQLSKSYWVQWNLFIELGDKSSELPQKKIVIVQQGKLDVLY